MVKSNWIPDELKQSFARASAEGKASAGLEPRAASARYDQKNDRVVVDLLNGCVFAFPPSFAQGLAGADARSLAQIEVTPKGAGLHWPRLDADLSVPGLIAGLFGSKVWMRELARRGGAVRSRPKAAAARENGKKGGRPSGTAAKKRALAVA